MAGAIAELEQFAASEKLQQIESVKPLRPSPVMEPVIGIEFAAP
jgi:hypothetical protein